MEEWALKIHIVSLSLSLSIDDLPINSIYLSVHLSITMYIIILYCAPYDHIQNNQYNHLTPRRMPFNPWEAVCSIVAPLST